MNKVPLIVEHVFTQIFQKWNLIIVKSLIWAQDMNTQTEMELWQHHEVQADRDLEQVATLITIDLETTIRTWKTL